MPVDFRRVVAAADVRPSWPLTAGPSSVAAAILSWAVGSSLTLVNEIVAVAVFPTGPYIDWMEGEAYVARRVGGEILEVLARIKG